MAKTWIFISTCECYRDLEGQYIDKGIKVQFFVVRSGGWLRWVVVGFFFWLLLLLLVCDDIIILM